MRSEQIPNTSSVKIQRKSRRIWIPEYCTNLDSRISLILFLARANTYSFIGSIKPPKGVSRQVQVLLFIHHSNSALSPETWHPGPKECLESCQQSSVQILIKCSQEWFCWVGETRRNRNWDPAIPTDIIQGSPDRVSTARELRLVSEVYRKQGRGKELIELLTSPNDQVRSIMDKNSLEFTKILLDTMEEERMWTSLWDFCLGLLPQFMANTLEKDSEGPSKGTTQATTDWTVWKCLMNATSHLPEAK